MYTTNKCDMFRNYFINLFQFFFLIGLLSCTNDSSHNSESSSKHELKGPLFSLVNNSGIDFVNRLTPTTNFSTFDYQYFQNGGGVAVADFNNDGLKDVFFTSNQESDKLYLNIGDLKFKDITESAKVSGFENTVTNSWSTGVTICDINNDGYMDIYICKAGPFVQGIGTQNILYVNNRNLTFTDRAKEYGIADQGHSTQAVFFDYDKDLDLDVFVMNEGNIFGNPGVAEKNKNDINFLMKHSSKLYKNENDKFVDVSQEAGVLKFTYGLGLVASDLDGDNDIDIYLASDFSQPDCMYLNNGDGTFTDGIKNNTGHLSFYSMGCDAADINNDGLLDISVVDMAPANNFRSKTLMPSMSTEDFRVYVDLFGHQYQYMFNALHLNQGEGQFSEIAKLAGVHKTDWSWSTLLADLDNDGLKDMFVSNGYKYNKMENDFSIEFDKMMAKYNRKVPVEVKAEWLEKPPSYKLKNYAFKNIDGTRFEKVSVDWGFKEKTFSNGAAYADFDNDGDLDIILNNIDDEAYLYENKASDKGRNYLKVHLQAGKRDNLSLILNAKVKVFTSESTQFQELALVRGFQSTVDNMLIFGLGNLDEVERVEVQWSDGRVNIVNNPKINSTLIVDKTDSRILQQKKNESADKLFTKVNFNGLNFKHQENIYDDFVKELLLPHKNSQHGPSISVGDINGDGLDDVFIGGAKDQAAKMYQQQKNGTFTERNSSLWNASKETEDIESVFFDADADGDLDLYVVCGGNEFVAGSKELEDKLFTNDGTGKFSKSNKLPAIASSGAVAVPFDIDADGDLDLFIGGRMKSQQYPYAAESYFLKNENGTFSKDENMFEEISNLGIVTDAIATDFNGDKKVDLIIVGEWNSIHLLQNEGGAVKDVTPTPIKENTGWWNTIEAGDFDNDGDIDYVVGNLGVNYKYQASRKEPFHIYANDFDETGNLDIVLGYFNEGNLYPLRGRECSSEQMPFLKEKFPSYKDFASATLKDVYGGDLEKSYHLQATNFRSSILINDGMGKFTIKDLPREAQYSCINGFVVKDIDQDGNLDIVAGGNLFEAEVETPRNDASIGLVMKGNGDNTFTPLSLAQSGFLVRGDVKDLQYITVNNREGILIANNDAPLEAYLIQ